MRYNIRTEDLEFPSENRKLDNAVNERPSSENSQILTPTRTEIFGSSEICYRTHVLRTAAGCFAVVRRIRSIRRSVTQPVLQLLVVALVLSRLDCGSTVLFGLPQQLVERLQSIQNAAARLVFAARRRDHISPLLRGLHWLRVAERTVSGRPTYLPLPPRFSTLLGLPVETTAASL